MTVFERISELSKKHGKSVKTVALDLGFSENLFYRWKETQPKASDLAKVADYFHTTLDDLMGREIVPSNEKDLLQLIQHAQVFDGYNINSKDKEFIQLFIRTYFEMENGNQI
ncbi:helix-turn-helix domain-containing protein [Lactococcus fujiensis]|uniref:HTH-type transcriptional regulator n=1 Tax=Lactococcus fujiensis JCM 16395 TaxID=1291764 RepID=A0A2A5RKC6_9LACT|nr:helix-turn-helix transcriptional regulator [Lactococcus fujiensis]PCR99619.1 HTH-type transcriptional regulator [Lactococcus fujiensis JCM 16395]